MRDEEGRKKEASEVKQTTKQYIYSLLLPPSIPPSLYPSLPLSLPPSLLLPPLPPSGSDRDGRPVIVFSACRLPPAYAINHDVLLR